MVKGTQPGTIENLSEMMKHSSRSSYKELQRTARNMSAVEKAGGGNKISQKIKNQFPDEIQNGKKFDYTIENGKIKLENGIQEVDFIIDADGNLQLGRGHSYLAEGNDVQAAGKMKINSQGEIRKITNESGHYQPTVEQSKNYPDVFKEQGFDVENAWMEIHEFDSSASKYIVDDKIIINKPIKYLE